MTTLKLALIVTATVLVACGKAFDIGAYRENASDAAGPLRFDHPTWPGPGKKYQTVIAR